MNGTLGREDIVPSGLVFGEHSQGSTRCEPRPIRGIPQDRAAIANIARKEVKSQMAAIKLRRALSYAVPPAATRSFKPDDKVLMWKEKIIASRIGEWLGLFEISSV